MSILDVSPISAKMYLKHPLTGEDVKHNRSKVFINVVGKDSEQYHRVNREFLQFVSSLTKKDKETLDDDYLTRYEHELLACLVVGWDEKFNDFFQPVDPDHDGSYNHDFTKKIIAKLPWFGQQIDEFVAERERFFGK